MYHTLILKKKKIFMCFHLDPTGRWPFRMFFVILGHLQVYFSYSFNNRGFLLFMSIKQGYLQYKMT